MDGRANPLMDRKVVGVVLFGVVAMVAVVTSLTTPGCSVVYILTSKCASRHNGVHFFDISTSKSELNVVFSLLIFFLLLFSSLTLPTSAFSSVHVVGCLTSKLSSNMLYRIELMCIYIYTCTDV